MRISGGIQLGDDAIMQEAAQEVVVFGVGAVAPDDLIGLREARGFLNPFFKWRGHQTSENCSGEGRPAGGLG